MRPICSHIGALPSHLLALQGRVLHAIRLRLQPFACSTELQSNLQEIWTE